MGLGDGLDQERIVAAITFEVQKQIEELAEPIIQKALVDIEASMRDRVNAVALKIHEKHYSFERLQESLVITIMDRRA